MSTYEEQSSLFAPEEAVSLGEGDNSPVEHAGRPRPVQRERQLPTLVLSVETEDEQEALVALLGGRVKRRARDFECWWPDDGTAGELRLDLGDGA